MGRQNKLIHNQPQHAQNEEKKRNENTRTHRYPPPWVIIYAETSHASHGRLRGKPFTTNIQTYTVIDSNNYNFTGCSRPNQHVKIYVHQPAGQTRKHNNLCIYINTYTTKFKRKKKNIVAPLRQFLSSRFHFFTNRNGATCQNQRI